MGAPCINKVVVILKLLIYTPGGRIQDETEQKLQRNMICAGGSLTH